MSGLLGFDIWHLDVDKSDSNDSEPTSTPRIIENIERMSERYRRYTISEIKEDSIKDSQQAERIRKLRQNNHPSPMHP